MNEKKITNKVLVIGAELEGLFVARELASRGIDVILTEKENEVGGRFRNEKLLNSSFKSSKIFLDELITEVEKNNKIKIMKKTIVDDISGQIGNFKAYLKKNKTIKEDIGIVVLTVNVDWEDNIKKIKNNFIPFSKFVERINPFAKKKSEILSHTKSPCNSVVLSLNDESLSRNIFYDYLKYALFLKKKLNCEVSVLLPQVLVAGDEIEKLFQTCRDEAVVFYKYEKAPEIQFTGNDEVEIKINDANFQDVVINADLFIYGEKIHPSAYFNDLKAKFKLIDFTNINFLSGNTPRKGIYFCGLCREDLIFNEILLDAKAITDDICHTINGGKISYEDGVIKVDKAKCTLCLTCVRACPHSAIEMNKDILQERVVSVIDEACYHCGICVGECPTKALSFKEVLATT